MIARDMIGAGIRAALARVIISVIISTLFWFAVGQSGTELQLYKTVCIA
ncbi:MAG: hypothetical protein GDA36_08545 [Rhodobacteraceae bacterium]|nr:hypothetical protein [Paracoccaceae bacterium]